MFAVTCIHSQDLFVLASGVPKKARSVAIVGHDDDPRGLLRIADAKAKVAAAVAPKCPKGKPVAALVAVGAKPPPASKTGKGKGKGKAKAKPGPPPAPAPGPPPSPPSSPDDFVIAKAGSSSSSKAAAPPPVPPAGVRRPKKDRKSLFLPAIGGGSVFYEEYREFGFGRLYKNWIFDCPHHGSACQRTIGVIPKNIQQHGILEPLAYLHVWRDLVPGPRGHRLTHADPADVASFYTDHQDELEQLADRFGVAVP